MAPPFNFSFIHPVSPPLPLLPLQSWDFGKSVVGASQLLTNVSGDSA